MKQLCAVISILLLAACSSGPSMPTSGKVKVGKPYAVDGKYYYPSHQPEYDEIGMASWYGPGFHGKRTASGETYNQNDFTAAHTTLPMPSLVRVTNLSNGKSVMVRVNDRGPFAKNRIIDLSKAAAKKIDLDRMGVAQVRVQYLREETESYMAQLDPNYRQTLAKYSNTLPGEADNMFIPTAQAAPSEKVQARELSPAAPTLISNATAAEENIFIQVGAFSLEKNAAQMAARVAHLGEVKVEPVDINRQMWYRVRLGPLGGEGVAENKLSSLQAMGIEGARIVHD